MTKQIPPTSLEEARIVAYERTGMTRSDAQACVEADELMGWKVIVSQDWRGWACILADKKTGQPVRTSDAVTSFRGVVTTLMGGRAPHKPESTGFVWTKEGAEFGPSVFGLEWVTV